MLNSTTLKSEPKYGNPPHRKCEICEDDGRCRNNELSKDYDIKFSDYLDCMGYIKRYKKQRET